MMSSIIKTASNVSKSANIGLVNSLKFFSVKLKDFSAYDPNAKHLGKLQNYVNGTWRSTRRYDEFLDPLHGHKFMTVPVTQQDEMGDIVEAMNSCPKSGLHNPFKNVERYLMYGQICRRAAEALNTDEVFNHFVKLIQRVFPKSIQQSAGEIKLIRIFFENFCGDNVRFLARGFNNPGDHLGQQTAGYRWPFGPVLLVSPFNFPLEIPVLQLMGALFMGNKVLTKAATKTAVCLEEFIRFLHACGLPKDDVILLHTNGRGIDELIPRIDLRMTCFTGSNDVAENLVRLTKGKIKIEDSGFDWKILGPDVSKDELEYVAHVSDQDAYAISGQKCSAQSLLICHSNWVKSGILEQIKAFAERRSLKSLTIVPTLSLTTKKIQDHVDNLLKIPGAKLLFGGPLMEPHSVPKCYGIYKPTAIFVPLEAFEDKAQCKLITTELFGPVQIVTEYDDSTTDKMLAIVEKFNQRLTAGIVSNDVKFLNKAIGHTVDGVTYCGLRARTTGAPQNHWFGPCGDPRAGGIGTPEAIKYVWSGHREIIMDTTFPKNMKIVQH